MKLPPFVKILTWNPTKIFAYEKCPLMTQLKYGLKLCPVCFKGKVGFDTPCDKCGKKKPKGPALQRGIDVDEALGAAIRGGPVTEVHQKLGAAPAPKVVKVLEETTKAAAKGVDVREKHSISLGPDWNPLPKFTKSPWFWGELDVLILKKTLARILDWKTGGLDKKTGAIRYDKNYQDQLEIYGIATLCAQPEVKKAEAALVFVDAKPPHEPLVEGPTVNRVSLPVLKKKWEERIKPMFMDDTFAARPSDDACRFCDYSRKVGGPCRF